MNELWKLLRCPACGDGLRFEGAGADEGLLRSGCGLWFPVVNGIPRIFVGEMRRVYGTDFADFLSAPRRCRRRRGASAGSTPRPSSPRASRSATSGPTSTRCSPSGSRTRSFYFEPLGGAERPARPAVLEGGCGKGRHTYYALSTGARLVAVDFSRAVDVAKHNCAQLPGERLFVQADLMSLPFAAATFDLAYSFGVLHHLPDPEAGFRKLVSRVQAGRARADLPLSRARGRAGQAGDPARGELPARTRHRRGCRTGCCCRSPRRSGYGLYAGVVLPYRVLSRFASDQAVRRVACRSSRTRDYPHAGDHQRSVRPLLGADREPLPPRRGGGLA